ADSPPRPPAAPAADPVSPTSVHAFHTRARTDRERARHGEAGAWGVLRGATNAPAGRAICQSRVHAGDGDQPVVRTGVRRGAATVLVPPSRSISRSGHIAAASTTRWGCGPAMPRTAPSRASTPPPIDEAGPASTASVARGPARSAAVATTDGTAQITRHG